ncbi:MAG: tyrosine--tRNA ligase [Candidatus Saccharimonadales bacterium]
MTLLEELTWRGFINQTTYQDSGEAALNGEPINFYWGVDPSSDSMTIGNLAAAMLVKHFMNHGHHAVLLIGGATGLIGDPDGKAQERDLKSVEVIESNKQKIVQQYNRLFNGQPFDLVDNYEWFKDMNYIDFLRDIGKHIPLNQMLGRDFVKTRVSEDGSGLSYAEFSYVLIQAYDFLRLYEDRHVALQLCGSDQWGNCIAGVDLIRRKNGGEANVFSTPLVINKETGQKFGKSEEGAVWLDPAKTSPTSFYQFWINTSDDSVEELLKIYTLLDKNDIQELIDSQREHPEKRLAQQRLAEEVTKIVHGDDAAARAKAVTEVLIGKTGLQTLQDDALNDLRNEIPNVKSDANSEIAQVLVDSGLASSKTNARQLIESNAISVNGQKVQKDNLSSSDFINGKLLIRRGKAFKDSALVELI